MADEQSPTVEIAPTVIVSNSDNGNDNAEENGSGNEAANNSSDEPAHSSEQSIEPISEQVTIAAIEAERDVALAEIHSDVERERIAVEAERVETVSEVNEELEECRREIATLTEAVRKLENLLIPPPPLEVVEVTEELPTAPETDLIQPSTQAPTVETMTELSEESVDERPEETIPNRVRRFIAI